MRIFLTGFMGAGKSYLGQELARLLGFGFIDLDTLIEAEEGKPISAIFAEKGEAKFREIERENLISLAGFSKVVVATGGGAPCYSNNMAWMNGHGVTVYLHAPVAILASRLKNEKEKRPLLSSLTDEALHNFIEGKINERKQFYEQSHLSFEVPENGLEGLEMLANYLRRFLQK
ncbi:MAG: AAA family ATPase [Bacteroidetes bacterium]|nr:AAA family ATPase [Bacteroidota bacterium]